MKLKIGTYSYADSIDIEGKRYPVKVYVEHRMSFRASIGKKVVNIRIPLLSLESEKEKQIIRLKNWARDQIIRKPLNIKLSNQKEYFDGDLFEIRGDQYYIKVEKSDRKTATAKVVDQYIQFSLPESVSFEEEQELLRKLLAKVMAKQYYALIENRVRELNNHFFQKEIKSIRLKNNSSNWGSCSSKHNINLSSRLLFAPADVIDYVIIHELAHLVHLNHSAKFWKLVKEVMPDYKEKEKWLKSNNHLCVF